MYSDDEYDGDVGLRDELEGLIAQDELGDDLSRIGNALESIQRWLVYVLGAVVIGTASIALLIVIAIATR